MACDPNELLSDARCLLCLTNAQLDAVSTYLYCTIAGDGPAPPGESAHILTEGGDNIAAENGDLLMTE